MLQFSKVDWRKGLMALAVLVVLAGIASAGLAWRHYQSKDPLKELPPGIYQSPQHPGGQTLPVPPPPRR
jgi:hypothetical protein